MPTDTTPPLPELPKPAWIACDTEGADFDITFVTDEYHARDVIDPDASDPEALLTRLYTADQMREHAAAALARAAEVERERDALRAAGALMANTMFNLAQRPGEVLTADLCKLFDKMRRDWDAAVAAVPMLPNSDLGHQAQSATPGVRSEPGGSS